MWMPIRAWQGGLRPRRASRMPRAQVHAANACMEHRRLALKAARTMPPWNVTTAPRLRMTARMMRSVARLSRRSTSGPYSEHMACTPATLTIRMVTSFTCSALRGGGEGGWGALEGKGPQRRPQKRLDRRVQEFAEAVGGGYCRLQMPVKLPLGVRETVAVHSLGALEGAGGGGAQGKTERFLEA